MIQFVDETLRDGPQSLWATRMKTESMLGAARMLNQTGFDKVCVASGASFETAVKFLREDPFERIRLLSSYMPDANIDILIRSRNLFGWERYPDEVIALLFKCLKKAGTQTIKVFDGLNDIENIKAAFHIGKDLGFRVSGCLAFSISPVHTDQHFATKARELIEEGVDSITLVDASGIMTGERTRSLISALKAETNEQVPIEFLAHHTMGLAHDSYREAMLAGVSTVATASTPLANGESLPSTLDILKIANELGIETSLNMDAIRATDDYFHWIAYQEKRRIEPRTHFDPAKFHTFIGHQIPGGMISNFREQLGELGLIHRLDEVLEEASRIRMELGYPIMVTPFSQFVGVQATFNVIQGERYKTVPHELYRYVLGHYGTPPGKIDSNVLDRILNSRDGNDTPQKLNFDAQILDGFRKQHGPFHTDEELLLNLFYGGKEVQAMQKEKKLFIGQPALSTPIRALLEHLVRNKSLKTIDIEHRSMQLSISYE